MVPITLVRSLAHRRVRLGIAVAGFGFLILMAYGAVNLAQAGGEGEESVVVKGALETQLMMPSVFSGDVRDVPKVRTWESGDPVRDIPRRVIPRRTDSNLEGTRQSRLDPLLEIQKKASRGNASRVFTTPDLNFEGTPFTGARPPDTVGDVGPNHYIQMVNGAGVGSVVRIFDKTGALQAGPFALDTLWGGPPPCTSGLGDPIVLYDRIADRWLMSEFSAAGNNLCIYISQTADPIAGGWFNYQLGTPNFPDYPKYGVWSDAYYVSTNESSPAAYALERSQMLLGLAAGAQRFTAPNLAGFGFQALTPGDLDGPTAPPAGSPGLFMRHRDTEAHGPGGNPAQDFLEIFELDVDFAVPANSTFTGPTSIAISEFDSDLCGFFSFFCFPQPGTANTLDPLREVVMWRSQYRNFVTHETLVGNLVTDVDGTDHGGIRWFELRKTGIGPWTLFQEGTFAPDAHHRWMGSIAMDKDGNIALGHSISSSTVFPSIRYVGRLVTDPLGTLPQGEATIMAGTGSQTVTTRWGDYSSMNVDPVDDCTFWYTNEYTPASGQWRTRIATFSFPSCDGALATIFTASMRGDQEVPPVVTTTRGIHSLRTNPGETAIRSRVRVRNGVDIFAAHIHCAAVGMNGPVGVTLFSGPNFSGSGTLAVGLITGADAGNGCGWSDSDVSDILAAMRNGDAYTNVHSTAHPGGVIRGQIEPAP